MRPGVPGEEARAPGRYADGGDDGLDLFRFGRRANDAFHPLDDPLRLFDPRPDWSAHLDEELALIGLWEELGSDEGQDGKRGAKHEEDAADERLAMIEGPVQLSLIQGVHAVEDHTAPREEPVESVLEPAACASGVVPGLVLPSEPVEAEEGRHRPGDQERGEEREGDRERERDEEQARLTLEEDRGQEDDDGGDGG